MRPSGLTCAPLCSIFWLQPSAKILALTMAESKATHSIDEADTFLPGAEELRGVINSGHRRGASVIRTVGDDHEPRKFSTYAACAIALIGKLPATLHDRSAPVIALERRLSSEQIESFRLDRTPPRRARPQGRAVGGRQCRAGPE